LNFIKGYFGANPQIFLPIRHLAKLSMNSSIDDNEKASVTDFFIPGVLMRAVMKTIPYLINIMLPMPLARPSQKI